MKTRLWLFAALLSFCVPLHAQQALRLDTSGKPTTTLDLSGAHVTGTLDPARLPALAPLLTGGTGTLNLSGYALTLPPASVVSAVSGAAITPSSVTASGGLSAGGSGVSGGYAAFTNFLQIGAGQSKILPVSDGTIRIVANDGATLGGAQLATVTNPSGDLYLQDFSTGRVFFGPFPAFLVTGQTSSNYTEFESNTSGMNFRANAFIFNGPVTTTNLAASGTISGNGSGITALNASSVSSGTLPAARLPASVVQYDVSDNIITDGNIIGGAVIAPYIYGNGDCSIDLSDGSVGRLSFDGVDCLYWNDSRVIVPVEFDLRGGLVVGQNFSGYDYINLDPSNGNLSMGGNLNVLGSAFVNGTVEVSGNVFTTGTITWDNGYGNSDGSGGLSLGGNFLTEGDSTFDGPITANSSFVVNDNATFYGHVSIDGDLYLGGSLFSGDGSIELITNDLEVCSPGSVTMFGSAPVAIKPATPTTLAEIVTIGQAYGWWH